MRCATRVSDRSGFGELALLYSSPRAASVLAITDCKLWVMERMVYLAIKRTYQEQLAELKRKMVASVPILAVLSEVALNPDLPPSLSAVYCDESPYDAANFRQASAIASVALLTVTRLRG